VYFVELKWQSQLCLQSAQGWKTVSAVFVYGKIGILVPQLSIKAQIGPSTLKSANPVLQLLFLGQVRPLTFKTVNPVPQVLFLDPVHPSRAHFVNI